MKSRDVQAAIHVRDLVSPRVRRPWRALRIKMIMAAARRQLDRATDEELTEILDIVRNHK